MMIFFDSVLKGGLYSSFSPNEIILYSTLVRDSMNRTGDCFEGGRFRYDEYARKLSANAEDGFAVIPCYGITSAHQKTMSKGMLTKALRRLEDKGWMDGDTMKVRIADITPPFYKVQEGTRLSGRQLIVYTFLDCRCRCCGGAFRINIGYMSSYFRSSVQNMRAVIAVLRRKGFVRNTANGIVTTRPD